MFKVFTLFRTGVCRTVSHMQVWSEIREELGWEGLASPGHATLQLDTNSEGNLDLPHCSLANSPTDLSCDRKMNSDYETNSGVCMDSKGYPDSKCPPHTDMDEGTPAAAQAQSSEPMLVHELQSLWDHGRYAGHGNLGEPLEGGTSKGLRIGWTYSGACPC